MDFSPVLSTGTVGEALMDVWRYSDWYGRKQLRNSQKHLALAGRIIRPQRDKVMTA